MAKNIEISISNYNRDFLSVDISIPVGVPIESIDVHRSGSTFVSEDDYEIVDSLEVEDKPSRESDDSKKGFTWPNFMSHKKSNKDDEEEGLLYDLD